MGTSFDDGLYDTCESKPRVRNGDVQWKPHDEKGNDAILSPQEAKQAWLEREVRSLKVALDRVAVPSTLTESAYWNPSGGAGNAHGKDLRHLLPGSGDAAQQGRALRGAVHGEGAQQDRALHGTVLGDDALRGVAIGDGGAHHGRALHGTALGDLPGHDRALHGTLRLEIYLDMIGLCMALRLEIYLDMIGLCMVVRLNNFMVFLEMNDSMVALNYMVFFVTDVFMVEELWVLHQCRHHGKRLEVEVVEKLNCRRCRMAHRRWSLEIGFVFVVPS